MMMNKKQLCEMTDPVDKNSSGIYQRRQEITLENCPFLKTLTRDQMTEFNTIHGTSFDFSIESETENMNMHGSLSLSNRMQEVNSHNCPFMENLTTD